MAIISSNTGTTQHLQKIQNEGTLSVWGIVPDNDIVFKMYFGVVFVHC